MIEQLRLLVRLQAVDKVLFELEEERKAIPARLAELSLEAERLESELSQAKAELEEVTRRRRELEEANETIRTRLRRAENRLMSAKSQREYRAAKAEIEEGKDALKSNDDTLLELMEHQEELQTQTSSLQEQHQTVSQQASEERQRLTNRSTEVEREIQRLTRKREKLCREVDRRLLQQYDFIRQRRQGVAVAPVIGGTCQICHMQLPPQQFNELQRLDKIMNCSSCGRLIYWAEAEAFADL